MLTYGGAARPQQKQQHWWVGCDPINATTNHRDLRPITRARTRQTQERHGLSPPSFEKIFEKIK